MNMTFEEEIAELRDDPKPFGLPTAMRLISLRAEADAVATAAHEAQAQYEAMGRNLETLRIRYSRVLAEIARVNAKESNTFRPDPEAPLAG